MTLLHCPTGKSVKARIRIALPSDYEIIKESGSFPDFDWERERSFDVYVLTLADTGQMMGLMSLSDHREEQWLKVNLLQSSKENVGKGKEYDHIAGVLLAFACREAFKKGYGGCIGLLPKTELMDHYIRKYKFGISGKHLSIEGKYAVSLIQKYMP